jgi:hypothetical protein
MDRGASGGAQPEGQSHRDDTDNGGRENKPPPQRASLRLGDERIE